MKLVVREAESGALRALVPGLRLVSSELTVTELLRAVLRRPPVPREAAETVLATLNLLPLDRSQLTRAGTLRPPELRSLDAIHLEAAQGLGAGLDVLLTYDTRLAAAARSAGLPVEAPGAV